MLSIAYVSTVTRELLEEGFVDLLHYIREKNRSLEISGMLLYCEEGLMQVIEGSDDVVRPLSDYFIPIPASTTLLQPLLATIPYQAFAAEVAAARGYDVDKPRNLAKSVTVE